MLYEVITPPTGVPSDSEGKVHHQAVEPRLDPDAGGSPDPQQGEDLELVAEGQALHLFETRFASYNFV